jgi:hypothetical protein
MPRQKKIIQIWNSYSHFCWLFICEMEFECHVISQATYTSKIKNDNFKKMALNFIVCSFSFNKDFLRARRVYSNRRRVEWGGLNPSVGKLIFLGFYFVIRGF